MSNAGFNYNDVSTNAIIGRTTIAAVIGGTASKISGGKFGNGAATAAMAQLFNAETSNYKRVQKAGQDALAKLREIDEFKDMEDAARKRYGKLNYVFGKDIGGSNFLKGTVTIDFAQVGMKGIPVHISALNMDDYVDPNLPDAEWDAAVQKFENMTMSLSLERIIVHEVNHGAVGSSNFLVNDHPAVIGATNRFMSKHSGELPRDPYSQGI